MREEKTTSLNKRLPLRLLGFTAPSLILVIMFIEIPFIMTVFYSFTKWNGISKSPSFIGFNNYVSFFSDGKAIESLAFTLLYALCMVAAINVLAILLSVMLEAKIPAIGFFRMSFYVPNVVSLVVIGFIWKFVFKNVFDSIYIMSGETLSFLNWSWLGETNLAFVSVVFVSVWQALGFYVIVYVAALQSVPGDLIEAAVIDGAGKIRTFFQITLPMIMPSITFCVFYAIANSFKSFDLIFTLTQGGPGRSTTSMALDIYNTAFNSNQFGYGSAKSVILFMIVAVITTAQISLFSRKEVGV